MTGRIAFLCFVGLAILSDMVSSRTSEKSTRIESIPNPMVNPTECGRPGVEKSIICDINNILSKENKDVIEGRAMDVKDAEFGVAIISRMIPSNGVSGIDESAEDFATTLHNTWGVGDKNTQNGVMIFLSINDRAVFISRGSGLQNSLSDRVLDLLVDHMKPYLREGDYGRAIEATIVEIDLIIHNKESHVLKESPWWSAYVGPMMFVFAAVGFCVFQVRQDNHERGLRRGQIALSQLMRDVESTEDNRFEFTSCPICLEDFDIDTSANISETSGRGESVGADGLNSPTPNLSPLRPMVLHCGHAFCYKCLEEYLKERNADKKCPICRAPVDPSQPTDRPTHRPADRTPDRSGDTRGDSNTHNDRGDSPSCSGSSGGGSMGSGYSNHRSFRFRRRSPELLYRMRRMRYLYPAVMTTPVFNNMQRAVETESPDEFVRAGQQRSEEVTRTLTDIAERKKAAARGSKGAKRSFGGGRSSGGRGGRW